MSKTSTVKTKELPIQSIPMSASRALYPFSNLKPPHTKRGKDYFDTFFVPDPKKEATLRSQASRRGRALGRQFSVHLEVDEKGVEGLRIYRIK
jgi:hypothetical protein